MLKSICLRKLIIRLKAPCTFFLVFWSFMLELWLISSVSCADTVLLSAFGGRYKEISSVPEPWNKAIFLSFFLKTVFSASEASSSKTMVSPQKTLNSTSTIIITIFCRRALKRCFFNKRISVGWTTVLQWKGFNVVERCFEYFSFRYFIAFYFYGFDICDTRVKKVV